MNAYILNFTVHVMPWMFQIRPLYIIQVLCSRFCQWSHKTAETVSLCPQNKSAMEERAKIKNCTVIAKIQRCTDPEKFKYHCVMNELETTFVELCAPQYIIHGTSIRTPPPFPLSRHCKIKLSFFSLLIQ